MPKIDKKTLKILPRTNIRIYKFENRNTYFCSFYIGLGHTNKKSGKFEKTLQTKNVNEAIKKATELYKEWFRTHTDTKRVKAKDFDIDIASPYLQFKIRKYKNKTHLKNNEQGERDKAKWNNYLKPFFEDVDYTDLELVEDIINDELLSKLKDDGKTGNTINKYMSLITQMFKRGQQRGLVNFVPDTPTQQVINTPRVPYENEELNLINNRCREEYNKTKDIWWLDFKDYLNLLRSAGFRPGLEPLNLKRKDFRYVSSKSNPNQKELIFDVWGTKTKPNHSPIANEFFTKHIFAEIRDRHSNLKENDYLLFPNVKDRKQLKHKTGKLFTRFSKELKLYYKNNGTRPLYAIRHTYATEQWKKGTAIEDIASLMNTSTRMVMSVYLGHTDEALLRLANRRGKLKVIK